jgi:hypothetical protein
MRRPSDVAPPGSIPSRPPVGATRPSQRAAGGTTAHRLPYEVTVEKLLQLMSTARVQSAIGSQDAGAELIYALCMADPDVVAEFEAMTDPATVTTFAPPDDMPAAGAETPRPRGSLAQHHHRRTTR